MSKSGTLFEVKQKPIEEEKYVHRYFRSHISNRHQLALKEIEDPSDVLINELRQHMWTTFTDEVSMSLETAKSHMRRCARASTSIMCIIEVIVPESLLTSGYWSRESSVQAKHFHKIYPDCIIADTDYTLTEELCNYSTDLCKKGFTYPKSEQLQRDQAQRENSMKSKIK